MFDKKCNCDFMDIQNLYDTRHRDFKNITSRFFGYVI
jgi:hypothetical protein